MIKRSLALVLLLILSGSVGAAQYEQGKQYTKISDKKSAAPQVTEFFSYYCPICFRFEPIITDLRKQLPKTVTFKRNHVDFLSPGHAPSNIQTMMTKVLAVTEVLGQEQALTRRIFDYIHRSHAGFDNMNDVRRLLVISGIDGDKFETLLNSPAVDNLAKQMKQRQQQYVKDKVLTGVPTIIVNGKYRVNAPELDDKNFEKDFITLVNYLLTLD